MGMILGFVIIVSAILLSIPIGKWMYRVMCPHESCKFEKIISIILGPQALSGQDWKQYLLSLIVFNLVMFAISWLILSFTGTMSPALLFNTVSSFVVSAFKFPVLSIAG